MLSSVNPQDGRVVGFMDIGTNSVRILVARVFPDDTYTVLTQQREVVRLGEGEFADSRMTEEAIGRAVTVCHKLAELARALGAGEIVAAATAASREAANKETFSDRLRDEAGIDVHVVSGREEARLVYLGVSSGMNLGSKVSLFVDIGGGSTELIVGGQQGYLHLDSVRIGAMRLTSEFFSPDETGPIPPSRFKELKRHVRHKMARSLQRVRKFPFEAAIGSSGTIVNLADVAYRKLGLGTRAEGASVGLEELCEVVDHLCGLSVEERRKVPGLNPRRADIIVAGGAILECVMEEMQIDSLTVSDRALLNGLVIDHISRGQFARMQKSMPFRVRSILQLARSFQFDERHARRVCRLAIQLFESARASGLHRMGEHERELLEYAALLHDIGAYLSYTDHQHHGAYFIRNAELLGFDQREVAIIAAVVLYHRKGLPKAKSPGCEDLDKSSLMAAAKLSVLLRIAESLNRGHSDTVRQVGLRLEAGNKAVLDVSAARDCQLELWGARNHLKSFSKVFGKSLKIESRVQELAFALDPGPEN